MTMIRPPSRYPRCICAIGRIFTFIPITTRCSRSTPPSCAGLRFSARLPAIASPRWTRPTPAWCCRFCRRARSNAWRSGFNRALLLTQRSDLEPQEALFEARNLLTQLLHREQAGLQSFAKYTHSHPPALAMSLEALNAQAAAFNGWLIQAAATRGAHDANGAPSWHTTAAAARVPHRIGEFGPLTFQNDDVLRDRLGEERLRKIRLLSAGSSRLRQCSGSKRALRL